MAAKDIHNHTSYVQTFSLQLFVRSCLQRLSSWENYGGKAGSTQTCHAVCWATQNRKLPANIEVQTIRIHLHVSI